MSWRREAVGRRRQSPPGVWTSPNAALFPRRRLHSLRPGPRTPAIRGQCTSYLVASRTLSGRWYGDSFAGTRRARSLSGTSPRGIDPIIRNDVFGCARARSTNEREIDDGVAQREDDLAIVLDARPADPKAGRSRYRFLLAGPLGVTHEALRGLRAVIRSL